MTTGEIEVKDIIDKLSSWSVSISMMSKLQYYDINKRAESIVLKILNLLFDYNLVNENDEEINAAGIDLSEKNLGFAIQVTSRTDTNKVLSTLRTCVERKYDKLYPNGIRFFIISKGEKIKFSRKSPNDILPTFDPKRDILYLEDLAKPIQKLYDTDEIKFRELRKYISNELKNYTMQEPSDTISEQVLPGLENLKNQHKITYQIQSPEFFDVDLSLPEMVVISKREKQVNNFLSLSAEKSIIWIYGALGTGKTGLAWLIAKNFTKAYWIDFRDITEENFIDIAFKQLCNATETDINKSFKESVRKLMLKTGPGTVFVLNDLPGIQLSGSQVKLLNELLLQAIPTNIKIIITSNYPPPNPVKLLMKDHLYAEIAPPFSDEETADVLVFYNAADDFIKEHSQLITVVSEGNPFLVNSAVQFLQQNNWNVTDDVFTNIFTGNYGQEFTSELYSRIVQSTQDDQTKDLLYRLTVIIGTITDKQIQIVGSQPPPLQAVLERSQKLKGIWLQEMGIGKFQLSPLAGTLTGNLDKDTIIALNNALGDHILEKKLLSQIDARLAISHFLRAKEYVKLSWVLVIVLEASLKNKELFFNWGFDQFWYYTPLPKEIPPFFRALIRIFHLNLKLDQLQDENPLLINELENILETEDVGILPKGSGYLVLSQYYWIKAPAKSLQYYLLSRQFMKEIDQVIPSADKFDIDHYDQFVWAAFIKANNAEHLEQWLNLFKTVRSEFNLQIEDENYVIAGNALIRFTAVADGEEVHHKIKILETVLKASLEADLELFAVYAIRFLVKLHAEYFQNLDVYFQYLKVYNALITKNSVFIYLVKEEQARQLYLARRNEDAKQLFAEFIATELPPPYVEAPEALRIYSYLIGVENPKLGHFYIQNALIEIDNNKFSVEIDKIRILGELGTSHYFLKNYNLALDHYAEAYEKMLKIFDDSPLHRATIIRIAHLANYVRGIIINGKPPEKTADGGIYADPVRGLFYFSYEKLLEGGFWIDERKFMGATVFNDTYEFLKEILKAKQWAFISIEESLSLKSSIYFPILHKSIAYLIIDREYIKAFNLYRYLQQRMKDLIQEIENGKEIPGLPDLNKLNIDSDAMVIQELLFPSLVSMMHDHINGKLALEEFNSQANTVLTDLSTLFKNRHNYEILERIFSQTVTEEFHAEEYNLLLQSYKGQENYQVLSCAYLLQGIHANAKTSTELFLALAKGLELYTKLLPVFYEYELIPFLKDFFLLKMSNYKAGIIDFDNWESKGIPRIINATVEVSLKTLFKVLVYHLHIPVSIKLEIWLHNDNN